MAVPVFEFPVLANDTGSKEYLTRSAVFGDGYEQVSGDGINSSKKTWSVSYAGLLENVKEVEDFLDERGGYKSFAWTDPMGRLGLYKARGTQVLPYSGNVFRLTTTFEQAFAP